MGGFVVPRGDAARIFQAAEHAFDFIALAIAAFLEWIGIYAVVLVGDDGFGIAFLQPGAEVVAVIGFIAELLFGRGQRFQKRFGCLAIRGVSRCQQERYRAAFLICCGMDFRRPSAPAPANGFRTAPFFPLAERCALTIVESMLFS